MNITDSQEDGRGEEQVVDGSQEFLGTTHLNITHSEIWAEDQEIVQLLKFLNVTHLSSTCPEIQKVEKGDTGGVLNSKSKLGDKESVLTLDNYNDGIITGQIVLLSKKYGFFRRIAGDGSCFYRAFLFSYLENVVETNDEAKRKAEAARLRQRVEKYMLDCHDEELLRAFYGFESVVNLIEQGLASGELYHMEKNEHVTSKILPLLRSLTEIEICLRKDFYHAFLGESYESVFELCLCEVRPWNGEANDLQVTALANALGIPIILENLDRSTPGRLNTRHIYPRQEFAAEALEQEQSVDSDDSTTPMAQVEHDNSADRNLSPAERRRLVTLLYRPGHYDIIYPK
ncbi:unnamed protein product [Alopecurus aequalis]